MGVEIKGLDSLLNKLNRLSGNADEAIYRGIQKSTLLVEGDAKDLCTVDTGRLRNSINSRVEVQGGEVKGIVGTNVEYAAYVEFGTGQRGAASPSPPNINLSYREDWAGMEAQPYLYPALEQNKENVQEIIKDEIKKEIKRLGG